MIKIDNKERKRNVTTLLQFTNICPFKWKKNLYFCFYCEENFSDPALLREHNDLIHASESPTKINQCVARLTPQQLVKIDITNLNCKLCDRTPIDLGDLINHLVAAHKKSLVLTCNSGILPFKLTKDNFKCVLCDAQYSEYKTLNQHMNFHFQNYICEQCGSGFVTPQRLRTHSYSHETGSYPCGSCDKVFRSTNAKNEHTATVHRQMKRHRCPHCGDSFRNYFQRNKHIMTTHGLKVKEFKCEICPKVFTLSGKLGHHIKTVHLKMKRHACTICEWKFFSKSELKDHMVRHGGERKHQCDICKKAYARKYTLREHQRIHEDDRRFSCSICGKSFVQNCSLKHHIKVHHPFSLAPVAEGNESRSATVLKVL